MSVDYNRLTPIEAYIRRRRFWWLLVKVLIVAALVYYFIFKSTYVTAYEDPVEHFKYGSIGSEPATGLPVVVLNALPYIYRDRLGNAGYAAFGMNTEADQSLPIGFSRRVVKGVELAWLNCAVCHVGTYQLPDSDKVHFLPGGASNDLTLYDLIVFSRFG